MKTICVAPANAGKREKRGRRIMTKYCTKCGHQLTNLPTYITSDNWQCVDCFEHNVRHCHAPLVKLNVRLMPAPFSTHDENYVELTNKRRYEA